MEKVKTVEIDKGTAQAYYSDKSLPKVYVRAIPTTGRAKNRILRHLVNRSFSYDFNTAVFQYEKQEKVSSEHELKFYYYTIDDQDFLGY